MASAAAELFVKVSADTKGLTSGLKGAGDAAKTLGDQFKKVGSDLGSAGDTMRGALDRVKASAQQAGSAATAYLKAGLDKAADAAKNLKPSLEQVEKAQGQLKTAFKVGMAGIVLSVGAMTASAVKSLMQVEKTNAQTENVIRSMGGAAGVTAQQVMDFANALERTTGIAAENIQQGQNLLLTFGNIKNGVGESNQIFDKASKLMVDLSAAMGTDAKGAAIQLGKALNDPTQGVSALSRVGVSFTDVQKDMIKKLQESGDMMGAQRIILGELEKQFGGTAEAVGKTLPGALDRLDNAIGAVIKNMMSPGVPAFAKIIGDIADAAFILSDKINDITAAITTKGLLKAFDDAFGPGAKALVLGIGAAVTVAVLPALAATLPALAAIAVAFAPVALAAAKFTIVAGGIAGLAYPIIKNWDAIKQTLFGLFDSGAKWATGWYNKAAEAFSGFAEWATRALSSVNDAIKNTFGVDLAAKLGVGISGASSLWTGFKRAAVTGLDGAKAAVGSLADTLVKDFSVGFDKAAATVSSATGKVSAQMIGLGDVSAKAADKAAKAHGKAKDAAKNHEKGIKEAEQAAKRLEQQTDRLYKKYQAQELATHKLGDALAAVSKEAALKGRSFDVAGATAKAYQDSLSGLEAAFGKMSPQAMQARDQIAKFTEVSRNGGKELADAFGVIDTAAKALDNAALKAQLMGKEFDGIKEPLASAEKVMSDLIDRGLRPGNEAFDEASRNLQAMRLAAEEAKNPIETLKTETSNLANSLRGVAGDMATVLEAFGIDALKPITDAVGKFANTAGAVVGLANNVDKLIIAATALSGWVTAKLIPGLITLGGTIMATVIPAVTSFGLALMANPIGLVIGAVAALVIAGLALYENWEFVSGKLGEAWDAMKRAGVYAFEAIGAAAKAVWDGVVGVVKGSVNAMIGVINLLIRGMNRIRIDIPPWVPGIGGKFFGVGIPQVPYLATGGLITGPTLAQMGEGGRNEAVLPLNDNVYRQLGEGIAAARGGAGGAQVVVQYYGNGKWTREDAQGLGRMLVSELRSMGVK
jgi:hypothetical protein